jgi:PAS domain S-box-containing protein
MKLGFWRARKTVGWRLEIAVLSVTAALCLELLLRKWFGVPYWFPFLVAGIASAWIGGRVAGWTAVIASTLACDYFFNRPYYSLAIDPDDLPNFILFSLSMMVGNWFGNWRRNAEASLRLAREQAESERRVAELRWQAVFDNSVVGTALADERGGIIAANRYLLSLLGAEGRDFRGLGLDGLIAAPRRAQFQAQFAELLKGQRQRIDLEIQHPPGAAAAWLRVHVALVPGQPEFAPFVVAFCEDISEQKRAAEALLAVRAELAHATRMTTIGELTASIAHELNQPLSAVVTNGNACLRWLEGKPPHLGEAVRTVNWIMRDARRASDVIARIRALIRKTRPRLDTVDFNAIVREGLELVRNELHGHKVAVAAELDPQLPPIQGERIQLQQVFLNLVLNAIEAMAAVADRPRQILVRTAAARGDVRGIVVDVTDNGAGVAAGDIDRLFSAFFTTKAEGTGLGLWICHSIVEGHAGKLRALRNREQGMTFRLELPCEPPVVHDASMIAGEDFPA